jgi:hypothetical protein
MLVSGETTLFGRVMRVGGAQEVRCALRVDGRHKLLFCDVANHHISQELGKRLYEPVVVGGTAQWISRSWRLISFRITSVRQLKKGSLLESMKALRKAGGDAWDSVEDPENYVKGLRS